MKDFSTFEDTDYKDIISRYSESLSSNHSLPVKVPISSMIPQEMKDTHKFLSNKLIKASIDTAFVDGSSEYSLNFIDLKPERSFSILEKLFKISKIICGSSVEEAFFDKAFHLFKIMHHGREYEFTEYFSDSEAKRVLELLDHCSQNAFQSRASLDPCTGRVRYIFNLVHFHLIYQSS